MNTLKLHGVSKVIIPWALSLLFTACFSGCASYNGYAYDRYDRYPLDRYYFGYPYYRYGPHPLDRHDWSPYRAYPYRYGPYPLGRHDWSPYRAYPYGAYPYRYGPGYRWYEPGPFRYNRDHPFDRFGPHPHREYYHRDPRRPNRWPRK